MKKKYLTPSPALRDELRRYFKTDHPFRDALPHENFASHVSRNDWLYGNPKTPDDCAYARSCKRKLDLSPSDPGVAILHSIAYIAVGCPESPTGWEILRFYIDYTSGAKRPHSQWDEAGGGKRPPRMVNFIAPSPARRMDARRAYLAEAKTKPRKKHAKRLPRVLIHKLPRGYEKWWKSFQQQALTKEQPR